MLMHRSLLIGRNNRFKKFNYWATGLKKTNLKYALSSVAIVIGFGIIKVSISDVELFHHLSCTPVEFGLVYLESYKLSVSDD